MRKQNKTEQLEPMGFTCS